MSEHEYARLKLHLLDACEVLRRTNRSPDEENLKRHLQAFLGMVLNVEALAGRDGRSYRIHREP